MKNKILLILILLSVITGLFAAQTAAADNGMILLPGSLFSSNSESDAPIQKALADNEATVLTVNSEHEWQQMMKESGYDYNVQIIYTLTISRESPELSLPVETTAHLFHPDDPTDETTIDVTIDENGKGTFWLPLGYSAEVKLPSGSDYTLTSNYPYAEAIYSGNSGTGQNGSISGNVETQNTVKVFYSVSSMPVLNIKAIFDGRGVYDMHRTPAVRYKTSVEQEGYGDIPVLVTDENGNKSVTWGWTNEGQGYAGVKWNSTLTLPLPRGTDYTISSEWLYTDITIEGEDDGVTSVSGTLQTDSVDFTLLFTLKLVTLYYTKYVEGPYNGEEFTLYLGLAGGEAQDKMLVPPVCTLNGKEIPFKKATTNLNWREWEIEIPIHGNETAVITNIPYGVYYFFSEIHNNSLDNYITTWGWPWQYDGSSGYVIGDYRVNEDLEMELAMTNWRFQYMPLRVSKELTGDVTDEIRSKEFSYTVKLWDVLPDGTISPIGGDFHYTITDADGATSAEQIITFSDEGIANFTLKGGETIYIRDLPNAAFYTVTEEDPEDGSVAYSARQQFVLNYTTDGVVGWYHWDPDGDPVYEETYEQSGEFYREMGIRPEVIYFRNHYPRVTISKEYDGDWDGEFEVELYYMGELMVEPTEPPELLATLKLQGGKTIALDESIFSGYSPYSYYMLKEKGLDGVHLTDVSFTAYFTNEDGDKLEVPKEGYPIALYDYDEDGDDEFMFLWVTPDSGYFWPPFEAYENGWLHLEVAFTNTADGQLTIIKTTEGAETPNGTVFTITGPDESVTTITYADFEDGSYTLEKIPYGEYTVKEDTGSAAVEGYTLKVDGNGTSVTLSDEEPEGEVTITNTYTPKPEETPSVPPLKPILPKTGFSSVKPEVLRVQPKNIGYSASNMTLEIPSLGLDTNIVIVPETNGEYDVTWLGANAGLLEGYESMILTGHNHLNTTEAGPFINIGSLREGDRIFIRDAKNGLKVYTVYANERIAETDFVALKRISGEYDNSLTLLTCENEQASGGYSHRRVISAKAN